MKGSHKIQSLSFEVAFPSEQHAQQQLQSLESIIKRRLLSTMEEVFEEFSLSTSTLKIEELNLDLGEIDLYNLDAELEYKLRQVLKERLSIILESQPMQILEEEVMLLEDSEREQDWLRTFLKLGLMPWWNQSSSFSLEEIGERIMAWHDHDPASLKRFVLENLSLPQFTKRLSTYTSPQFIKKISFFDSALAEVYLIQIMRLMQDHKYPYFSSSSYSRLWATLVQRALATASPVEGQALVNTLISSLVQIVQKDANISEEEAILWFYTIKDQGPAISRELKEEVVRQMRNTRFYAKAYVPLTDAFIRLSTKKAWLLGAAVDEQRFFDLAATKSFRVQFIDQLLEEEKMAVLQILFPQQAEQIRRAKEWVKLLMSQQSYGPHIAEQLQVFTYDELLKQLTKTQVKSEDTLGIVENMIEFLGELTAEAPIDIMSVLKNKEIFKSTEKEGMVRQLYQKVEEKNRKQTTQEISNDWVEEVLFFLLRGRKVSASTSSNIDLIDKMHVAIQYLSGTEVKQLKWPDGSSIDQQVLNSFKWQKTEVYSSNLQEKVRKFSVLEVALLVERIKNLPLTASQKETLLNFSFKEHTLSKVILSKESSELFTWLENDGQLQFTLQYILKFNRPPLSVSSLSAEDFLILISMVIKSSEWMAMADLLKFSVLLRLMSSLKELSNASISQARIQKLQAIVGAALEAPLIQKLSTNEFKQLSENLSASAIKEQVKSVLAILEKEIKRLRLSQDQKDPEKVDENIQQQKAEEELLEEMIIFDQLSEELEKLAEKELDKSLFIQNAGIVLLGPYLPRIFDKLALLNKEGVFIDEDSKIKAVEVIHYLAFGTDEMMEYTTILNKLMVAMPVSTPLETQISLSDEDKELCESLLKAVLQNWTSLKSSSIDNLRGTFFIREGKLSKHEDKYILKVEEKGFDMLLDKVPWSFKLMKYKWMKKPIFVEWR